MTALLLAGPQTAEPGQPSRLIRVLVAAGSPVASEVLAAGLGAENDIHALGGPSDAPGVARSAREFAADVVVADIALGTNRESTLLEAFSVERVSAALVILVSEGDAVLAARLVGAGAAAAVLKTAGFEELLSAVRWASKGAGWISPPLLRDVLEELHRGPGSAGDRRLSQLTGREREVIQLMIDGLGRRQIAERLFLSTDTVRTHMRTIMEKLGVHSATAVVSIALAAGLRPGE